MGKIVGGFLVPHDPVMFIAPKAPQEDVAQRMWGAFATCAERLADLNATSVVVIGADHYMLFGTGCLPQYLIGTGDVDGPIDPLPGLRRGVIPDNQKLANFIAEHGTDAGGEEHPQDGLVAHHARRPAAAAPGEAAVVAWHGALAEHRPGDVRDAPDESRRHLVRHRQRQRPGPRHRRPGARGA